MAKIALGQAEYDNAVMSAVHSAINGLDALTTLYLSKRSSGAHSDVMSMVSGIFTATEFREIQKQFTSLMSLKNASEYQPDLMSMDQAEKSIMWSERILAKVKVRLKDNV